MDSLVLFFIILLVAVIFSQLFTRMKIPWVVALIVGGIFIGPSGFDIFVADPTIEFFAHVGLVFLMFMAGLESNFSSIQGVRRRIATSIVFVGLFPPLIGAAITIAFGYSLATATLVGIIFMSSAIALLIPQLHAQKIINSELGKVIVASTIIIDALSLLLLSVFLQTTAGTLSPLTIALYPLLFCVLYILARTIPRIRMFTFEEEYAEQQDLYEKELRFLILVLVGFVIMFELVGLHAIIAAFFAGLVLSKSLQSRLLKAKLHTMSYGFLVPVFFVTVGASVDITLITEGLELLMLAGAIIVGLVLSKFLGGMAAGILGGFNNKESAFLGVAALPQLSTALAVAFLGFGEGLLDQALLSSIIALSVVTAIIAPIITSILGRNLHTQQVTIKESVQEV